jgi:hypothetical protein
VALLDALTAMPLPHPVKVANAPSDNAPNATLIKINIFPHLKKSSNCWPAVLPVAKRHSSAEPSGRQGGPKSARHSRTRLVCGWLFAHSSARRWKSFLESRFWKKRTLQIKFAAVVWGQSRKNVTGLTKRQQAGCQTYNPLTVTEEERLTALALL